METGERSELVSIRSALEAHYFLMKCEPFHSPYLLFVEKGFQELLPRSWSIFKFSLFRMIREIEYHGTLLHVN
jgi:hypothetical protein